MQKQRSKRHGE